MWAGIVSLLKALPALIALVKGVWAMWIKIKEAADKKSDEEKIKNEKDSAHNGGRPSAD
jgi:hypothetical protein